MIPQIVCYISTPPKDTERELVGKITALGITPMVDSVHRDKAWFTKNYYLTSHKAYFSYPFPDLLNGSVDDVDFEIMGPPHFCLYYTTTPDMTGVPDAYDWKCITKFLAYKLHGVDEATDVELEHAKLFLQTYSKQLPFPKEKDETLVETNVGEFVIERSLEDYYYKFESKFFKEADLMIYQVTKPFVERPFTVIIEKFSVKGAGSLFTDLFNCSDWGRQYTDIKFLESLWAHLGLLDDEPFDIEKMLKEATEACYPNESCEVRAEPRVFRKPIDEMVEMYGMRFTPK